MWDFAKIYICTFLSLSWEQMACFENVISSGVSLLVQDVLSDVGLESSLGQTCTLLG